MFLAVKQTAYTIDSDCFVFNWLIFVCRVLFVAERNSSYQTEVSSILDGIDNIFESTFSNNSFLWGLEKIHSNYISLWVVCTLYKSYFDSIYNKYIYVRLLHFSTKRCRINSKILFLIIFAMVQFLSSITSSSLLFVGLLYLYENYGHFPTIFNYFKTTHQTEFCTEDIKQQNGRLIGFCEPPANNRMKASKPRLGRTRRSSERIEHRTDNYKTMKEL